MSCLDLQVLVYVLKQKKSWNIHCHYFSVCYVYILISIPENRAYSGIIVAI